MKTIRLVIVALILLTTTEVYSQFYYTLDSLVTTNEELSSNIKRCTTDICPRANMSVLATNNGMIIKQYYRIGDKVKSILTMKYYRISRVVKNNVVETTFINKKDLTDVIYSKFNLNNFSEIFEFKDSNGDIYAIYYFSLTKKDYLCIKDNHYETVRYTEK